MGERTVEIQSAVGRRSILAVPLVYDDFVPDFRDFVETLFGRSFGEGILKKQDAKAPRPVDRRRTVLRMDSGMGKHEPIRRF